MKPDSSHSASLEITWVHGLSSTPYNSSWSAPDSGMLAVLYGVVDSPCTQGISNEAVVRRVWLHSFSPRLSGADQRTDDGHEDHSHSINFTEFLEKCIDYECLHN